MATYPVRVLRHTYRGNDRKKLIKANEYNRDAAVLEAYINKEIEKGKRGIYFFSDIAHETGYSIERVREILFGVDCGSNGFTVAKSDE